MDIEKVRSHLATMESALSKSTGPHRVAIQAAVDVAKACLSEIEKTEDNAWAVHDSAVEAVAKIDEIAEDAIAKARAAESRLAIEKAKQIRTKIEKSQALDREVLLKSVDQVRDAFKSVAGPLADLMAIRRWSYRTDSGLSCLSDTRKTASPDAPILVWDPGADVIIECTRRDHAISLIKGFVRSYVKLDDLDVSKVGVEGVDFEDENPGKQSNGAPAEWPPRDMEHDPVEGPRVVDDKD